MISVVRICIYARFMLLSMHSRHAKCKIFVCNALVVILCRLASLVSDIDICASLFWDDLAFRLLPFEIRFSTGQLDLFRVGGTSSDSGVHSSG